MRKKRSSRGSPANHFWQSYSDIMAALLLVFVLVLFGAILKAQKEFELEHEKLGKAIATAESIAEDNKELAAQLDKILGIRAKLIEDLVRAFDENNMGGKLHVDEQTGSIILESKLLFEFGEHVLSEEGKAFLMDFMPKYTEILLSAQYVDYVAEIVIEGHTDQVDEYLFNLNLSQDRAYEVAAFVFGNPLVYSPAELEKVLPYISVNGRSENELIYNAAGQVDEEASRRVEIQFRLKDDEMIKQMREALSQ